MNNRLTPVSRLTVIFILVVIISGSLLTYFSINNISNLKELTEKKILEEQRELTAKFSDAIQNNIEDLTTKFKYEINTHGLLIDSLLKAVAKYDRITLLFLLKKDGTFIFPNFTGLHENLSEPNLSNRFKTTFEDGERAEFAENESKIAKEYYLSCLRLSTGKGDSAKALNALGRISLKLMDYKNAFAYYKLIISNFFSELSPNGFPYAYYAIPQLIKISDTATIDETVSLIEFSLEKMETGAIPLNFSTEELLTQVEHWTKGNSFEKQKTLIHVNMMIENLNLQLQFISEHGSKLSELVEKGDLDKYLTVGNGYNALFSFSERSRELILINTNFENPVGYVIDNEKLFTSILKTNIQSRFEFDYLIEFPTVDNLKSSGHNLIYLSQLNPYFPRHMIQIKVKDENLIKEFITRRSWIYGIASLLLLVGMFLGIVLILKDISREKQIARLRSEFISNVTHELKTPLTSIHMFAESLLLDRVKSGPEKKEYLSIIIKESERLKRMINNILEFSKAGRVKPEYHFVESNLSTILKKTIHEMNYWFEEEKFDIVTDLDENISAKIAPDKIRQAFGNLLNNAIKYSVDTKKIFIRLFTEAKYIYIEVEDLGIGIPEDRLSQIFEKYYRIDQIDSISGTGLGLTVVKEIVDAHSGKILVTSHVGKGSKFSIILPQ